MAVWVAKRKYTFSVDVWQGNKDGRHSEFWQNICGFPEGYDTNRPCPTGVDKLANIVHDALVAAGLECVQVHVKNYGWD
jgi:hypothetical protein